MTVIIWLLLAACEFPCSAYRSENENGYALQVEPSVSVSGAGSQSHQQDALAPQPTIAAECAESEEKAIQDLAKLWGYPNVDISNITKLKAEQVKGRLVLGKGFDVTFKGGAIVTLAIKQQSPANILDLKFALCGLSHLEELLLDGSNVTGHLKDLRQWNQNGLTRLSLRWCRLEGDLKDLKGFTKLEALKLSGSRIRGFLEDLRHLEDTIKFLDLRETSVRGDLSEAKMLALKGLWLQKTLVTGDIMQLLKNCKKLVYLHLSQTKVGGYVRDPEAGEGKDLKEMVLVSSGVKFEMNKPAMGTPAPFPNLTTLDVTKCNLSMDVWDFLYPFAKSSYHLAEVKARNCSLSGRLEGIFKTAELPLLWQIRVLDLSYNNITKLSGEARACWLDVSHNPHLEEIDRNYFQKATLLDMRNTSYNATNQEALWDKILEKEDVVDQSKRCAGVRPIRAQGRVLVTPSTFDNSRLCGCRSPHFVETEGRDCCGCKPGLTALKVAEGMIDCVSCFGPGCDNVSCFQMNSTQAERHAACLEGYTGPLCAACAEKDYRSSRFGHCERCSREEEHWRLPMICSVAMMFLLAMGASLWHWVWKKPDENTASERGLRFLEFLEQFLLVLTYLQLLVAVLSLQKRTLSNQDATGEGPMQRFMKKFIMLDVAWVLDMLSVECMLGYQAGRNLQILASALLLPALVLVALILGSCVWGSPFYGVKYAIVITSVAFQSSTQTIWGNLFWCQTESQKGWSLGGGAFLRQRPWLLCSQLSEDPLKNILWGALIVDGIVIPGCLGLLGAYITRQIRGVESLSASLIPLIQCDSKDSTDADTVTLEFATVPVAAEKLALVKETLGAHVDFPNQVIWIYAAAYAACIADSIGCERVEVTEARFGETHNLVAGALFKAKEVSLEVLKMKLTKGSYFQEAALQEALTEARGLSKALLHRAVAKQVMLQQRMGPVWIGTRNSFERFAEKDPLLCECLWKLLLLCVTKMCVASGDWQMTWVATAMAACAFGVHLTKPFGSRSRNMLSILSFGALSGTCAMCALPRLNGDFGKIPPSVFKILQFMPTVLLLLFFVHLQLMPGDILLRANGLQADMKRQLGASKGKTEKKDPDKSLATTHSPLCLPCQVSLPTSQWNVKWCPEWWLAFIQWYRGLASSTWYSYRRGSSRLFNAHRVKMVR